MSHETPPHPWYKLGVDFFEFQGKQFILIADYFSRFPVVRHMNTTTAKSTVKVMKTIFAEYGVPVEVMSDQGPQFKSEEYQQFGKTYNFNILHSSPRYPQANGFIESMVKVVKGIMRRAAEDNADPHLGMLIYRTTPLRSGIPSPAEMLTQRKFRALLPTKEQLTHSRSEARQKMLKEKEDQKDFYNRKAQERAEHEIFSKVRVQLDPNKPQWQRAVIIQTPTDSSPRRYRVQTQNGQEYDRNSKFIKAQEPQRETAAADNTPCTSTEAVPTPSPSTSTEAVPTPPASTSTEAVPTRRSARNKKSTNPYQAGF